MTLTIQGRPTSSVTWPFDSPQAYIIQCENCCKKRKPTPIQMLCGEISHSNLQSFEFHSTELRFPRRSTCNPPSAIIYEVRPATDVLKHSVIVSAALYGAIDRLRQKTRVKKTSDLLPEISSSTDDLLRSFKAIDNDVIRSSTWRGFIPSSETRVLALA